MGFYEGIEHCLKGGQEGAPRLSGSTEPGRALCVGCLEDRDGPDVPGSGVHGEGHGRLPLDELPRRQSLG
jgi:hypothetical protein